MAAFEAAVDLGPELPGDRRPRHQRRRAARLPRRPAGPGDRRDAERSPTSRGRRCGRPGSAASSRSRCSRTSSAPGPTCGSTSTSRPRPAIEPLVAAIRRTGALRPGVRGVLLRASPGRRTPRARARSSPPRSARPALGRWRLGGALPGAVGAAVARRCARGCRGASRCPLRAGPLERGDRREHRPSPRGRGPGARLDRRRAGRDAPAARPRRRRADHRPGRPAARGARGPGSVAGMMPGP